MGTNLTNQNSIQEEIKSILKSGNACYHSDSNSLTIYHQNICGLKGKTDELISSMSPSLPHILCFSEHHLKHTELEQINIEGFKLCTAYCRQAIKRGGVCIFIQKGLEYSKIDVNKYCKDQDILLKFVC